MILPFSFILLLQLCLSSSLATVSCLSSPQSVPSEPWDALKRRPVVTSRRPCTHSFSHTDTQTHRKKQTCVLCACMRPWMRTQLPAQTQRRTCTQMQVDWIKPKPYNLGTWQLTKMQSATYVLIKGYELSKAEWELLSHSITSLGSQLLTSRLAAQRSVSQCFRASITFLGQFYSAYKHTHLCM